MEELLHPWPEEQLFWLGTVSPAELHNVFHNSVNALRLLLDDFRQAAVTTIQMG